MGPINCSDRDSLAALTKYKNEKRNLNMSIHWHCHLRRAEYQPHIEGIGESVKQYIYYRSFLNNSLRFPPIIGKSLVVVFCPSGEVALLSRD